ncbi:MAG: replicative DNA helicase [Gammaproteobacteria bacterium]|nr:replicative DNA helicase [Gammaproteobacteria bacterium]
MNVEESVVVADDHVAEPSGIDHSLELNKGTPYANYSEQVVLARLMTDEDAYDLVADRLRETDFYRSEHKLIYAAISSLGEQNHARDVYAIGQRLDLGGTLAAAGGMSYLADLCTETSEAVDLDYHISTIRQLAIRRQLVVCAGKIMRMASTSADEPIEQMLDRADSELFKLTGQNPTGADSAQPLSALLEHAINALRVRYESGQAFSGLETGYADLDRLTDGLQKSDMVIIAARPSMGKTALALCIANHVATKLALPVLFFSLEMPKEQISNRILSMNARVSQSSLRSGKLSRDEWTSIMQAYENLEECPLYVDDSPALTVSEVRTRVRRFVREHPNAALIAIDYLQLMSSSPGRNDENRSMVLGEITRSLKILAREVRLPVIVLSQLNRATESRTDKKPLLSDLRESGAIEQDADLIMFVHRADQYKTEGDRSGETDIVVGKHRNGATLPFKLQFEGEFARFENFVQPSGDDFRYIP